MRNRFWGRVMLVLASMLFVQLGFTSCERMSRDVKSKVSSMNGLNRQVTLINYQGDTIKQWSGKLLISSDGTGGYVFDDDDNKRVIIKGGIIVIEEK